MAARKARKAAAAQAKPIAARMLDLITGYWVSQLVHVAAKLGLADLLKDGPRTPAELARKVGVDAQRLQRMLRALASVGVFAERGGGRFALTPLGATLRGDRPDSMRDFALMMVEEYNWNSWSRVLDGIREEIVPFQRVHGMRIFEYFGQHPEHAQVFGRSMTSLSGTENPAVVAAYDFSKIRRLVDVGGSHGHLLAAVLHKNRNVRGVLFDMPPIVEQARHLPYVNARKLAGRIEFEVGDFFQAVPDGCDAYMMKYILHDWNDDECVAILRHCRRAMTRDGRILVIDTVIPPGNAPHWGKLLDINMLALTGGRERTRDEFAKLFARAGLKLKRVVPTACPLSVLEGVGP